MEATTLSLPNTLPNTLPARAPAPLRVRGLPLVGSLFSLLRDAPGFLLDCARKHPGELFSVRLGPLDVPIVYRPEHLQTVMVDGVNTFTKGGMWSATRPLLGNGLVTSEGDFWRKQRKLLQPLFTPRHIGAIAGLMADAVEAQMQDLDARAGQVLDIGTEMTLLTQRVLLESLFGTSMNPQRARKLGQHLNDAFEAMNYQLFLFFLPAWFPRPAARRYREAVAALDAAVFDMVAERRAKPSDGSDVLSRLLDARDADTGEGMSDQQIRDELVTLFVAGLDTTAVTLTWLCHVLDTHPEVDSRIRAEIASVLGGRRPTGEDVQKLVYTRQVLQETMRVYPPSWMVPRFAAEDAEIDGRRIPAGSSMLVVSYLTHHDPLSWEDPETFKPERFSPEASKDRARLTYVPFGAGGRMCIGNHFAMMEAMLAAVALIQRFRPRGLPGAVVRPQAVSTLKPAGGLKMRFDRA